MNRLRSWRPLLRLAWRDVRRRPLRTLLVMLVVAVPVAVITGINVGMNAANYMESGANDLSLGQANVRRDLYGPVADPQLVYDTADAVVERRSSAFARTPADELRVVDVLAGDVFAPLTGGRYELVDGRVPSGMNELTVSTELRRDLGLDVGDTIEVGRERTSWTISGVHRNRDELRSETLAVSSLDAPIGRPAGAELFYVDDNPPFVDDPMINGYGETPRGQVDFQIPVEARFYVQMGTATFLVLLALLISTAFASAARRQLREVGLIGANGGNPRQIRAAFALQGMITAGFGVVLGFLITVVAATVFGDEVRRLIGQDVPFGVLASDLVVSILLVLTAGWLAAWWPARSVARTPVLAALGGRRPSRAAAPTLPVFGVALIAIGIVLLVGGISSGSDALPVIGGVLLIVAGVSMSSSWLVSVTGRLLGRMGAIARVTGRSLDRQRTRTGPIVAAIAIGGTAGVLGIVVTHTEVENALVPQDWWSAQWGADADPAEVDQVMSLWGSSFGTSPWLEAWSNTGVSVGLTDARPDESWVMVIDAERSTGLGADRAALLDGKLVVANSDLLVASSLTIVPGLGEATTIGVPTVVGENGMNLVGVGTLRDLGVDVSSFSIQAYGTLPEGVRIPDVLLDRRAAYDIDIALDGTSDVVAVYAGSDSDDIRIYRIMRNAVGGATGVFVLAALAIGLGLSRIEQRDDELLLAALGAAPTFRRRAGALEAGLLSGLAVAIAVPLGLILAFAIRSDISTLPTVVPWPLILGVAFGIPLASAVLFGFTRRTPKHLDLRS
jgi:putative ABC transport system permease protein